uniref:Uncharacterized protein n=1 Tax=Rhizosolenia imbricata TaxID=216768 RepID=A0A089X7U1_9STRA|nr:hypothetical protein Ycf33 [Rhizosolenia imbricata]AIR75764.1 hypothetical protein Ycf33 [Rhizosolenia imbricata]
MLNNLFSFNCLYNFILIFSTVIKLHFYLKCINSTSLCKKIRILVIYLKQNSILF